MSLSSPAATSYLIPSSPLWVAGRALLARRGIALFACWSGTGKSLDPVAIHDLRVATRRVRECVALFGPCYRGDDIARLNRKLRRLTARLGTIRDTDEALLFLQGISGELSPSCQESLSLLLQRLKEEREAEAARLGRFLRKTRRHSLIALFMELSTTPDLFSRTGLDPFMPARRYVREAVLATVDVMAPLVTAGRHENATLAQHAWRIAVKKLRYRLEIVAPVLKSPPDPVLTVLKRYQELLGTLHDLDVYRELVITPETEREAAEIVGIIRERRARIWQEVVLMAEEQPWDQLVTRIEEIL